MNQALFVLPPAEIKAYGLANLTYGSLTERGIRTMTASLRRWVGESVYGFDLGCGDGELIYQLGLLLPESRWEGVEISDHRVSMQTRDVSIWQGDMLADSYRDYNVLHADNLCLDEAVADRLEAKIALEFKGLYITYRQPENMDFLKRATYLETVLTETTWTTHPIHFYYL
uniref:Methyltransferase n=1 Tax=viral metagenome TaxID=1070528 RepID=A0A6C0DTD8_9ZZZZ